MSRTEASQQMANEWRNDNFYGTAGLRTDSSWSPWTREHGHVVHPNGRASGRGYAAPSVFILATEVLRYHTRSGCSIPHAQVEALALQVAPSMRCQGPHHAAVAQSAPALCSAPPRTPETPVHRTLWVMRLEFCGQAVALTPLSAARPMHNVPPIHAGGLPAAGPEAFFCWSIGP